MWWRTRRTVKYALAPRPRRSVGRDAMSTGQQYEFDAAQNESIRQLSRGMRIVGIYMLALGTLYAIAFVLVAVQATRVSGLVDEAISLGVGTLFVLILGWWTAAA